MDAKAVISLPPGELAEFAEWFEEFRAEVWDKQIEEDLKQESLEHMLLEAETHGRPFETNADQ